MLICLLAKVCVTRQKQQRWQTFWIQTHLQKKKNVLLHYEDILLVKLLWQNQNYQLVLVEGWD